MPLTWIDVREMQQRLPDLITMYKLAFVAGDEARKAKVGNEIHELGDRLAVEVAAVRIEELLEKQSHGYRPTLQGPRGTPEAMLADIYDLIAEARGLKLRAYRGTVEPADEVKP